MSESELKEKLEREKELERIKSIFTLDNMKYKFLPEDIPESNYYCDWTEGFEGEEIKLIYRDCLTGKPEDFQIVVLRVHIDALQGTDWLVLDYNCVEEIIFTPEEIASMHKFTFGPLSEKKYDDNAKELFAFLVANCHDNEYLKNLQQLKLLFVEKVSDLRNKFFELKQKCYNDLLEIWKLIDIPTIHDTISLIQDKMKQYGGK